MSGAAYSGVDKDKNYYCFACAIGGDVIDYVSWMFGLSEYDAALKLVEDFNDGDVE